MHVLAVSCRISRRGIGSDRLRRHSRLIPSIAEIQFDDRTGQSGRIANFVHSARGFIACPVRSGMRMGCSAGSAQGCDADACTTPAKWHNARVVRAESVQQPLKTIAPTVVHRRSSWKRWNSNGMRNGVRGLSGRCMYNCCVCLQCARCTGGYAPLAVTGR